MVDGSAASAVRPMPVPQLHQELMNRLGDWSTVYRSENVRVIPPTVPPERPQSPLFSLQVASIPIPPPPEKKGKTVSRRMRLVRGFLPLSVNGMQGK